MANTCPNLRYIMIMDGGEEENLSSLTIQASLIRFQFLFIWSINTLSVITVTVTDLCNHIQYSPQQVPAILAGWPGTCVQTCDAGSLAAEKHFLAHALWQQRN